jgi:O-antigen ligase
MLLLVAAFLIPLAGGQVFLETIGLTGGPLDLLNSLFGGPELPTASHLVLAVFVIGAFVRLLLSRRVVQTPNGLLSGSVAIFFAITVITTAFSPFKLLSVSILTEWLTYGFALFAVVGLAGRRDGPRAITIALFAGCVLCALRGIQEYGVNKAVDPAWRIFGGWNNPNALAAMLLVGFFLGVGLTLTEERLAALLAAIGTVFIGLALFLTQSKGGLLVLLIISVVWAALAAVLRSREPGGRAASAFRVGGIAVALLVVFAALTFGQRGARAPNGANAPTAVATSHLLNVGESADQSAGFRKLLWQTSLDLIKKNPAGYGLGSFRHESGRPGLTTQTVFAHSAYLQLAVEGSPLLLLAFLAIIGIWLWRVMRGIRTLPALQRTRLLSIVAAVAAVLAHSFIDSDIYYFGVGLSVFILIGLSLLLAADAVAPEFLFPAVRGMAAGFGGFTVAALSYFAFVQYESAIVRGEVETGKGQEALDALTTLKGLAPMDGEVWYMAAQLERTGPKAVSDAESAVDAAPSTRNLRLLARLQEDSGQIAAAETSDNRALVLDPNNLATLYQLASLQRRNGDTEACVRTLRRLIGVENTNYFKVRSLPELVPTETYLARLELAEELPDPSEKRRLLAEAVAGFREYLAKTIPKVVDSAKASPPINYAGITVPQAKETLGRAAEAATELANLDRRAGDAAGADAAGADAHAFSSAL